MALPILGRNERLENSAAQTEKHNKTGGALRLNRPRRAESLFVCRGYSLKMLLRGVASHSNIYICAYIMYINTYVYISFRYQIYIYILGYRTPRPSRSTAFCSCC